MTTPYTVELTETNTPAWALRRHTGLGASDAPVVLELSPWVTPYQLWEEKQSDVVTDEQNEAMEFGHLMEPIAVELFRRRHTNPDSTRHAYLGDIEPSPGLIRSNPYPWLLASLDSVIVEDGGARVPGQIKNVSAYKQSDWSEGVPDMYTIQVLQEMLVLGGPGAGVDHGYLLPIFGGNHMPEPMRIEWDQRFVDYYLEESEAWWTRHMVGGEQPEYTVGDDLSSVFAGVKGQSVTLSPENVARAARHKELGGIIKDLTAERDALKFDVQLEMQDSTEAVTILPDNSERLVATWRPHARPARSLDKARLEAEHPGLLEQYMVDGKTPRPFLSK